MSGIIVSALAIKGEKIEGEAEDIEKWIMNIEQGISNIEGRYTMA